MSTDKTALSSFDITSKAPGPLSIHRYASGTATFEDGLEVTWCNSPIHASVHVRKVETGRRIAYSSPRVKAVRDRFRAEIDKRIIPNIIGASPLDTSRRRTSRRGHPS